MSLYLKTTIIFHTTISLKISISTKLKIYLQIVLFLMLLSDVYNQYEEAVSSEPDFGPYRNNQLVQYHLYKVLSSVVPIV